MDAEKLKQLATVRYVKAQNWPEEPREQYVLFIGEEACVTSGANTPMDKLCTEVNRLIEIERLKARLDELIEVPIYPKGCHTPEAATRYVLRRIETVESQLAAREKEVNRG